MTGDIHSVGRQLPEMAIVDDAVTAVLDAVATDDSEYVITKNDQPVAVVVSYARYQGLISALANNKGSMVDGV